jgi:hypothetical protein
MSLVDWAEHLRSDESLAILSGFSPDHTPSFGAFYDFFHRLWPGCNNFLPHLRYRRKKPPKGKGNGEKSPSFDKDHADTIIKYFKKHSAGGILKSKLYIIGEIYSKVFMTGSMHKNLLDVRKLVLAGDGTPVKVSNRERSHSMCDCHEKGIDNCHHKRWFSQPDAIGAGIRPEISSTAAITSISSQIPTLDCLSSLSWSLLPATTFLPCCTDLPASRHSSRTGIFPL